MNRIRIEVVATINNRVFMVYHSDSKCYQFSIIDEHGCVYNFPDIFYLAQAAEIEARKTVNILSNEL